jgi:hypothetical protein
MKKHLISQMDGTFKDQTELIFKKKREKYHSQIIEDYIRNRELFINDEKSKQWLLEHGY